MLAHHGPALDEIGAGKTGIVTRLSCGVQAIAALILAVILVGGIRLASAQEVSIKVLVNDDPISDYDIDQRERFLAITTQQQPSTDLKKEATNLLIDERLQMQQARTLGITPMTMT